MALVKSVPPAEKEKRYQIFHRTAQESARSGQNAASVKQQKLKLLIGRVQNLKTKKQSLALLQLTVFALVAL